MGNFQRFGQCCGGESDGGVKYSSAAKQARLITSVPGGSGPEALSR